MKKVTEIICEENLIDSVDEILPLNVGDTFYFSVRGTTTRSENEYKLLNSKGEILGGAILSEQLVNDVFSQINEKAEKHHIKLFQVEKISKSYHKRYNNSIVNPYIEFVVSITVKDITHE